ncbi:MAG: hypothetical protein ACYTGB_18655, partial [Planctomycetota bacterium]
MLERKLILTVLIACACGAAPGGEASFTAAPRAVAEGEKVRITFALSEQSDVVVGIVNEKGTVVRHLAGGMLGKSAPRPLQAE